MSPDGLSIIGAALSAIAWAFFPFVLLPLLMLIFPNLRGLKAFCDSCILLIDGVNTLIGETVKWGLPLLVFSVAFSVFALSIFGLSWTKLFESAKYFHASVIMLGAAATLLASQHVRVDIFHTQMRPRSKALVDFCGFYLCLLPVCLILVWNSQSFTAFSWLIFEGSPEADGIRGEFLLKTLIPVFAIMMIAQGSSIALRAAMCLRDRPLPARPSHIPPLFPHSRRYDAGSTSEPREHTSS